MASSSRRSYPLKICPQDILASTAISLTKLTDLRCTLMLKASPYRTKISTVTSFTTVKFRGPMVASAHKTCFWTSSKTPGEQRITFEYHEFQEWRIRLPTGSYTKITFSEDGILTIQDLADLTTTFDYQPSPGQSKLKVLSTITYPTGLSSRCEWGTVGYLDAEGSVQYMSKVNNHYQMGSENMIYNSTSHDLGGYTGGNTYTGAAIGLKLAEVTDTPMDGEGRALSYKYGVTRTSNDNDENGIARTTTYFNNYHLPIQQIKYSLED
ncbi:hypothetical protein F4809DRAFT_35178 [Biscogniauxia mediterranea]|nr:hypothetical protein F4809DRAFT_35178 [Biscogniauxia mediterranea]